MHPSSQMSGLPAARDTVSHRETEGQGDPEESRLPCLFSGVCPAHRGDDLHGQCTTD